MVSKCSYHPAWQVLLLSLAQLSFFAQRNVLSEREQECLCIELILWACEACSEQMVSLKAGMGVKNPVSQSQGLQC